MHEFKASIAVKRHKFWHLQKNQQAFLNDLSIKLGIIHTSDWGKVTNIQVKKNGGSSLLSKFGSIPNVLRSVFPSMLSNILIQRY